MHTTPNKPVSPEALHDGYEVADAKVSVIVATFAAVLIMGASAFPIIIWLLGDWDKTRIPKLDKIVVLFGDCEAQIHRENAALRRPYARDAKLRAEAGNQSIDDKIHLCGLLAKPQSDLRPPISRR